MLPRDHCEAERQKLKEEYGLNVYKAQKLCEFVFLRNKKTVVRVDQGREALHPHRHFPAKNEPKGIKGEQQGRKAKQGKAGLAWAVPEDRPGGWLAYTPPSLTLSPSPGGEEHPEAAAGGGKRWGVGSTFYPKLMGGGPSVVITAHQQQAATALARSAAAASAAAAVPSGSVANLGTTGSVSVVATGVASVEIVGQEDAERPTWTTALSCAVFELLQPTSSLPLAEAFSVSWPECIVPSCEDTVLRQGAKRPPPSPHDAPGVAEEAPTKKKARTNSREDDPDYLSDDSVSSVLQMKSSQLPPQQEQPLALQLNQCIVQA